MANSDKNILITPNVSAATGTYPSIKFNGANNTPINLNVLDDGTTSFTATSGQLFSISDVMTGSIFSVNDISGVPSMEVLDTGLVKINQYSGSTVFGGSTAIQSGTVNSKVSVYTTLANTPGIIIKGVSSQSSDLQIWQDSSGILLSSIKADGGFYMPNSGTANTKFQIGSFLLNGYGANYTMETVTIGSYIDTDRFASGGLTIINRGGASNITLGIKAAASQTADLTQWRNSAGTVLANVDKDGLITSSTTGDSGWIQITSFTNSFTATNNVYYRKLNNVVWIRGSVSGGTANTSAFTLPSGYRPSVGWVIATQQYGTSNDTYVTIGADGTVAPNQTATWFNISFPVG